MAVMAQDKNIKTILLDIAKEEKTHVGEFQILLLNRDKEQAKELEAGKEEVKKEVGEQIIFNKKYENRNQLNW